MTEKDQFKQHLLQERKYAQEMLEAAQLNLKEASASVDYWQRHTSVAADMHARFEVRPASTSFQ